MSSYNHIQLGKSKSGKDTKIVSKESIKNIENKDKIVELKLEEDNEKNIWQDEEIIAAPVALDVIADTRIRPEYDVKYQQYVGTEDMFLQVNTIKKIFK